MIYLSDDYIEKYQDTLSYLIGRAIKEGYSFDVIERNISYSKAINELEKSNITTLAFSSSQKIYFEIFPLKNNEKVFIDMYGVFGWLGYTYIRLFIDLKITFELLFAIFPLEVALDSYPLYHEMDYSQTLAYVKSRLIKSPLNVFLIKNNMSSKELSNQSNIPYSTIRSLQYGIRDFDKFETYKAITIASILNVKVESLLTHIPLYFYK